MAKYFKIIKETIRIKLHYKWGWETSLKEAIINSHIYNW